MAALKNRTVETESLESYVGKKVSFEDGDDKFEGEVTQITTDGYLLVSVDDVTDYQLTAEEVMIIESETEEEVETKVEDETEEEDETEIQEKQEILSKEKEEKQEITVEMIQEMSLTQVKQFIREQGLKGIPLQLWQKEKELKDLVIEKMGLKVEKKVTEKKKKVIKEKKEKMVKEKKERVKKEKSPKKETLVDQICKKTIDLLREKNMTKKELFEEININASKMTKDFCINFVITVTKILDILVEKDGKFSIK